MKAIAAFIIGCLAGSAATLIALAQVSEHLGLKTENDGDDDNIHDWDDPCEDCPGTDDNGVCPKAGVRCPEAEASKAVELKNMHEDECRACKGPVWIDGVPRCGHYPDSPECDNELKMRDYDSCTGE